MELFPTPTTELPDQIVAVDADFDAPARSLLWMPIRHSGQIVVMDAEKIIAVDADFDAPARSKNEYDSSDEENERMEELLGVWSKINADDLSTWVGMGRRVSDWWEKNKKNKKERTERTLNQKKAKRTMCMWVVS